jgi:hypothetical protein
MALLNLSCHQVSRRETQREREGAQKKKSNFYWKDNRNKKTRHHHRYRFYLFATMNRQHMCFFFRVYVTINFNRPLLPSFVHHCFSLFLCIYLLIVNVKAWQFQGCTHGWEYINCQVTSNKE